MLMRAAFATDDGRAALADGLSGLLAWYQGAHLEGDAPAIPYPEIGRSKFRQSPSLRDDVVIITGRFRSGSTLLWNLFRQAGGFTAYYEPLNERRWFDPRTRGRQTDATHINISEYWREYDGLEILGEYYREDWIRRCLLMDVHAWDPEMKRYVDTLIERAESRPVLQFNRIDFRLPWFQRHYPNATYIHIFRHPREQWCSTLMGDVNRFTNDASFADFPRFDRFYLRMWADDLKYHFPFLDERRNRHPYQLFYYIWKLSYIFGVRYCHHSIQLERLINDPHEEISRLFRLLGVEYVDPQIFQALVVRPKPTRWRNYADEAWFQEHEAYCDSVLAEFLRLSDNPAGSRTRVPQASVCLNGDGNRSGNSDQADADCF
jgi:Sulfotransferase family